MKNTVFIIGAGFSRDVAGYPLLGELTDLVLKRISEEEPLIADFIKNNVPNSIKNNIEYLLSYLHQRFPWRSDKDESLSNAAYCAIADVIGIEFDELDKEGGYSSANKDAADAGKKLAHSWHKWQSPVITFNYDLLIEKLLTRNLTKRLRDSANDVSKGVSFDIIISEDNPPCEMPGGKELFWLGDERCLTFWVKRDEICNPETIERIRTALDEVDVDYDEGMIIKALSRFKGRLDKEIIIEELYEIPVIRLGQRTHSLLGGSFTPTSKLYKLHGSINWLAAGTNYEWEGQVYLFDRTLTSRIAERNRVDLRSLIIPPVMDKTDFYASPGIPAQWRLAGNEIRNAERIVIVGYSLPETDLASMFFLSDNIGKNDNNAQIFVVNAAGGKGAEAIKETEEEIVDHYARAIWGASYGAEDKKRITPVIAERGKSSIAKAWDMKVFNE